MTDTDPESGLDRPSTLPSARQGVTRDEVRHVAALASLELTSTEEERMERDLNTILGYVAELNELDTEGVPPMSQVSEILLDHHGAGADKRAAELRADQPRPSLDRDIVMQQAPRTDGIFFKVPKVIER